MTAALCMSALDDAEDDPPSHYLRAMPTDQDENDDALAMETETAGPPSSPEGSLEIPPPPREATDLGRVSTMPPRAMTQEELDNEADAIRASLTPAGIAKVAADKLIEMYQYTRGRDFELLDPKGKLANQQRQLLEHFKTEVVNELGAVVESVTGAAMSKMGKLLETHGNDIATMKRDIAGMKRQVKALEQKMKDLDAARQSPPAPTG